MSLAKKIQENIFRHKLFQCGEKIVIGVSGGPDSVCLLDVLYKLKEKYDIELIIAHVNFGLRGTDSKKDEEFVEKLAEKYRLPIETKIVTRYALRVTEDSLRNIRYKYFEQIRKKYRADLIATAHNLNDQAETVLMRILRGTGLRGLGGIKTKNNNVIRPLLNIPRKEILAYLQKNKIPYRVDKTNFGTDFTRNKIRNRLIPYLEKEYNPGLQNTLYHLSQSVTKDYEYIHLQAKKWILKNQLLSVRKLIGLPPALRNEILRQKIEELAPSLREIESAHVDEIIKVLKSTKKKRQKITFKGLKIERRGDKLVIGK